MCSPLTDSSVPPGPREFRGVWVATVDNIDWPSKRTLTSSEQRSELVAILEKAQQVGLNAVVFQIRPSCDSMYASKIEPWSEFLTGQQGRAPVPYWDPLSFAVAEAHKRGLELHAWFNPYRAKHPAMKGPVAGGHVSVSHPELAKSYGDYLWLDPGEPAVQKRSLDVMLDVVRRYDVDGIHIDDYFYPYKSYAKGADFPDEPSWQKYRSSGGSLGRSDWRRRNVDEFVRRLYTETKKLKRWVKVGISPFGIYRPGHPSDVKTSFDQYEQLYADARKWLREGWCDYYAPQLYWRMESEQPFRSLLNWWAQNNPKSRHLWPGLFTGRVSASNGDWPIEEIVGQVEAVRDSKGSGTGTIHFSMRSIAGNWKGLAEALRAGPYASAALVPASPWLSKKAPPPPEFGVASSGPGRYEVSVRRIAGEMRWLASYTKRSGNWRLETVLSSDTKGFRVSDGPTGPVEAIAVAVVDRYGVESGRTVASVSPVTR